jgi:hypothetical protein
VALLLGPEIGVVRGSCLEDVGRWLWAGREHCVVSDLIQYFQTELNLIKLKDGPPKLKKNQIKYIFEGNRVRNKFSYRNFSKFDLEFELKFKEALEFEF